MDPFWDDLFHVLYKELFFKFTWSIFLSTSIMFTIYVEFLIEVLQFCDLFSFFM